MRHDGWYYLFASTRTAAPARRPATPSRSDDRAAHRAVPGPEGLSLDRLPGRRYPVLSRTATAGSAPATTAWFTDLSGQDWIVYHAIDRADPFLDEPFGINERPMLIDRLDWINGWPAVRAGAGPSEQPRPAPVTTARLDERFDSPALTGWRAGVGAWRVTDGRLTGAGALTSRTAVGGDLRAEADLRLTGADAAGLRLSRAEVRWTAGQLTAREAGGGTASVPLPAGVDPADRHNLAVEVRGRQLVAELLTQARLGDQLAVVALRLTHPVAGPLTLLAEGGTGEFDNVSATRLYRPGRHAVAPPRVGPLLTGWSDEFDDGLDPAWQWIRRNPAATVTDGALRWPVESTDLVGIGNTAGVLLRDAPTGDYVAETKVTLDLGEGTVRNYQQAGLVAYVDDDRFARLSQVAIWNTRQVEYGYELPFAGQPVYGGSIVGTPATTTWLRLAHHVDPGTGEHEFRAGSSRDGTHWTWGACGPSRPTPRPGSPGRAWRRQPAGHRRVRLPAVPPLSRRGPSAVVRTTPARRFSPGCRPCR